MPQPMVRLHHRLLGRDVVKPHSVAFSNAKGAPLVFALALSFLEGAFSNACNISVTCAEKENENNMCNVMDRDNTRPIISSVNSCRNTRTYVCPRYLYARIVSARRSSDFHLPLLLSYALHLGANVISITKWQACSKFFLITLRAMISRLDKHSK